MKVYDDAIVTIQTPDAPAAKGHVEILPKASKFEELSNEDVAHLLSACSFCSTNIFEGASAHGSNIIVSDVDSLKADVIGRFDGDGLNFMWDPKQFTPQEMDDALAKIKDKCDYIGVDTPKKESETVSTPSNDVINVSAEREVKAKPKTNIMKRFLRMP